jgi:hypothetical protein
VAEIKVNISDLKGEGGDVVKELVDFLKQKTNSKIETAADEITVKNEEETLSKPQIRVLLRKYLHKTELKEYFRVIGGKENTLVVKEIKAAEEE